ncbi:hypothetical protein AVEN_81465-1 [Araneus ventricosus]|uniref:ribonuclease H n=1 Tax=Araneus ventricosus TaxID=182803 RepID=A0A4Y2E4A9_ARAVE|nr:hypothetical protein AVEN_81465-1 [Araneus ventricosus]
MTCPIQLLGTFPSNRRGNWTSLSTWQPTGQYTLTTIRAVTIGLPLAAGEKEGGVAFVIDKDHWKPVKPPAKYVQGEVLGRRVCCVSHFEVYTDGSKVDGGVGFSVCILHGKNQHKIICKKLEPQNTVSQAELAALGEVVDWAIENKKKINICTDSRSSIEALKSYGSRSKFIISIKNKFCLAEGLVGLAWVKAHVGISGNELADHFAKLASVEGEGMDIPFPYSFVKFTLKKKLLEDWQIYYGAYETASGNRIRGFVPRVDTKTLIKSKYLIYFLTGHGPFPCYLSRFKILSSPLSECGSLGDPDRYLLDYLMTQDHHLKKPSCEAKCLWLKNVMSTVANHEKLVNCFKVNRAICDNLSRV